MMSANPRRDSRIECVVHDIDERVARLHKSLTLLDQRIASDEAARRNEADRLHRYVDAVLAKVARLEFQLGRASRGRLVNETTIMRAGQALAAGRGFSLPT
jgi:hypothetical protein